MAPTRTITLDLTQYYDGNLCPGCDNDVEQPDESCECGLDHENIYSEYREAATQKFGDSSLPLCRHCFFRHADWEEEENFLPSNLDGISGFERHVLSFTTLAGAGTENS